MVTYTLFESWHEHMAIRVVSTKRITNSSTLKASGVQISFRGDIPVIMHVTYALGNYIINTANASVGYFYY